MVISSSKHLKMTIKQRERIQNFLQHKKVFIFDGKNENLGEAEMAKSHHVSDGKQNLWKTLRHAAAHQQYVDKQSTQFIEQSGQESSMEDKGICLSEDRQIDEEGVNDGGNDHLLILAQSAELVMGSEDRLDGLGRIVQNNQGLHVAPMAEHSFGNFRDAIVTENGARSPRLSQIRRQARSKCDQSEQGSIGDCAAGHLQGGRTRLTQIRHQARFKNHLQMQDRSEKKPCMNSQERIIRLSQLRRLARSKSNSIVKQAIPDHMHGHSDYQPSKDNQKGRIIAAIFGEEDSIQVDAKECDNSTQREVCWHLVDKFRGLELESGPSDLVNKLQSSNCKAVKILEVKMTVTQPALCQWKEKQILPTFSLCGFAANRSSGNCYCR